MIEKLGYAVGFIVVIMARQQLFTENTLTAVLPVIVRRKFNWLLVVLRLWGIVLVANLTGCPGLCQRHRLHADPDARGGGKRAPHR